MSTLVVCDASPLIFLSKIKRLELIRGVAGDEVVVLQRVCDEVLSERGGVGEVERLADFLKTVRVENFVTDRFVGNQLSVTDRSSLVWALENEADRLLADEVLLRRIAKAEGLEVVGVMGLLVQAVRSGHLTREQALDDVEALVHQHGLRISLGLYRKVSGLLS